MTEVTTYVAFLPVIQTLLEANTVEELRGTVNTDGFFFEVGTYLFYR